MIINCSFESKIVPMCNPKSFCFIVLLLVPFMTWSQQKMTLLNGKVIEIKSYTADEIYINYKMENSKRKKPKTIEKLDVFAIKKEDGTEELFFNGDSLIFTVVEARTYIMGEQAAMKFYRKPWNNYAAFLFGAGTSALQFYSLPLPMMYSVVLGRFNTKKMQIPEDYDAPYSATPEYFYGYQKKARNMKIQQSIKWGYIGLGVGLSALIIYGFSKN